MHLPRPHIAGVVAHLSIPVAESVWDGSFESGLGLMLGESGKISGYCGGNSVTTAGGLRLSTSSVCGGLGVSLAGCEGCCGVKGYWGACGVSE